MFLYINSFLYKYLKYVYIKNYILSYCIVLATMPRLEPCLKNSSLLQ